MSDTAMLWAIRVRTPMSHASARVLMVLASYADDDGMGAAASFDDIAQLAQADRSTVARSLEALATSGIINYRSGGGRAKTNQYVLDVGGGHDMPDRAGPVPAWASRPSAWQRICQMIFARDQHTCTYCRRDRVALECDHVLARSRGGTDDPSNLTTSCKPCNRSKGAKLVAEWVQ